MNVLDFLIICKRRLKNCSKRVKESHFLLTFTDNRVILYYKIVRIEQNVADLQQVRYPLTFPEKGKIPFSEQSASGFYLPKNILRRKTS